MTSQRRRLPWVLAGAVALGGCSLMGYFEEEPARGCDPGETRFFENDCGVCDTGTRYEICTDGEWVLDRCENETIDGDGDTVPNAACDDLPEGCCTTERDCDDVDPAVGVLVECWFRDPSVGTGPQTEECALSCGATADRSCTAACTWGECTARGDGCDGIDNDCDTETDEDAACIAGTPMSCRTSCDPTGTETGAGVCSEDCLPPTGSDCVPPEEVCDGRDNDCDTSIDDGFTCVAGASLPCATSCGGALGSGLCSAECVPPSVADCAPPDEECNGIDDDCDTAPDEDFACVEGSAVSCTSSCATTGTGTCTATCGIPGPGDCTPPAENCGNGVDDDCDTVTDEPDPDQCVPGTTVPCRTTCDGTTETRGTGVCTAGCVAPAPADCTPPEETCTGRDDDCDTRADEDFPCRAGATGVTCTTTCGSTGTGVCTATCGIPAAADCTPPTEICNGLDDDCVGGCDNGFTCCVGATDSCSTSCSSTGERTCSAGCAWGACVPPAETCNAADDDCDGDTDEDFTCISGRTVACTTTCGSTGSGACTTACEIPLGVACIPPAESCNATDDDCDGDTDETFACVTGRTVPCTTSCTTTGSGTCTVSCAVPTGAACTPPAESCNAIDDDCDGDTDETFACVTGRTVPCTTTCGSTGSGSCTSACEVPLGVACIPPAESCNATDDDCDTETDETFACVPGTTVPCTTSCTTTGSGTCTASCAVPTGAACTPPAEVCNAIDDDCDGDTDEGFACVSGRTVSCATTCGSTGSGTCTAACAIPTGAACAAPPEVCNGVDDDCVAGCDNGFTCCAGATVSCTTTCGSTGSGTCTAACGIPAAGACTPPAEVCNGLDDDCAGGTDDGFDCARGSPVSCTTTCGTTGSGICTSACEIPTGAACTPPLEVCNGVDDDCDGSTDEDFSAPDAPRPTWPENGARTGSDRAAASLRPTFRWLPVAAGSCGAITYDLQVDDGCLTPGFASCTFPPSPAIDRTDLTATSYTHASALAVDTTAPRGRRYYWRVRACDPYRCGAWSAVRYVDVGRAPNDFNGDGWSDWLIGAWREDNDQGRIRLYLGSGSPDADADADLAGDLHASGTSGDNLGEAIAGAGDVDADGYADFVVAARNAPLATPGRGRVYLFLGGPGYDLTADVTYVGADAESQGFAEAVAGVGDVDADGYADVLVGSPYHDAFTGRAFLYRGGETPDDVADGTILGRAGGERFGWAISGAGDVNADGHADLLVGAYTNATNAGRAYVFFGGPTLDTTEDATVVGSAGSFLGQGVGRVGDFNGDGIGDIVIGAPGSGQVQVLYGGDPFDAVADFTLSGSGVQKFGYGVGGAGDVDGDGFDDLVVGIPEYDGAFTRSGACQLYRGAATPATSYHVRAEGSAVWDRLGFTVGATGDVDGDGFADGFCAAPSSSAVSGVGAVEVHLGSAAADWTTRVVTTGSYPTGFYGVGVGSAP